MKEMVLAQTEASKALGQKKKLFVVSFHIQSIYTILLQIYSSTTVLNLLLSNSIFV